MSLKEFLFFRIPQQFQFNVLGRVQSMLHFDSIELKCRESFKTKDLSYNRAGNLINFSHNFLNLKYFDCEIDLSKTINWLKDYKNNKSSTIKYYSKIDKQDFETNGDIKYIFEPSRFYFLPFLALKANHTKNSDYYLSLAQNILYDWKTQNPYLKSIHWTSGIEIGIRSVNLIYTHLVLKLSNNLNSRTDTLIKELILFNYRFLKNHLSLYSSANNHLVAELTGLVVITSYFSTKSFDKSGEKWRRMLYDQVLKQVNEDGVNMELCTHYHAEVTDHFFNALLFIKRSGNKVPKRVEAHYLKMFDFLDHVEYNGLNTVYGDNDEGYLINPYIDNNFSIYRSLLQSSMIEFNNNFYSKYLYDYDLRNHLIFGDKLFKSELNKSREENKDTIFKNSGYAFFYKNKDKTKVAFDFGEIGDNISSAHGHSDIFHFTLEIEGQPILIDSGTYQYHKKYDKWRSYFRGIKAHNTISVNNKDHAVQASRMSWINRPKTTLLEYHLSNDLSFVKAETDAFSKENILHQRKLLFNKKENRLIINDELLKERTIKEPNRFCFLLNFSGNLNISHLDESIVVHLGGKQVVLTNGLFSSGKLIKSTEKDVMGWRSYGYNKKEKGQVFILELESKESISLRTEILINETKEI